MRIQSSDIIGGLPALQARELMRRVRDGRFGAENVEYVLGLPVGHGVWVIETLESEGFIIRDGDHWRTTLEGNALSLAKASKPVSRSVADRNLQALIERAQAVNDAPEYLYWVEELVVFGSYLSPNVEKVGDVDVAIELRRRIDDGDEFLRRSWERVRVANRRLATIAEQVFWPQMEVLLALKAGSRVLSFTDVDDPILETATTEVVYRRTRPAA